MIKRSLKGNLFNLILSALVLTPAIASCTVEVVSPERQISSEVTSSPEVTPSAEEQPGLAAPPPSMPRVVPSTSVPRYDPKYFGRWIDIDRDGCNTRAEVIERDAAQVTVDRRGCAIDATIIDPYTGETVVGWDEIDIDHRIPRKWAWDHGAHTWTKEQRITFSNDLTNLVATSDDVNRDKSDLGPEKWLPWDPARCQYAAAWRATLVDYQLSSDPATEAGLTEAEKTC